MKNRVLKRRVKVTPIVPESLLEKNMDYTEQFLKVPDDTYVFSSEFGADFAHNGNFTSKNPLIKTPVTLDEDEFPSDFESDFELDKSDDMNKENVAVKTISKLSSAVSDFETDIGQHNKFGDQYVSFVEITKRLPATSKISALKRLFPNPRKPTNVRAPCGPKTKILKLIELAMQENYAQNAKITAKVNETNIYEKQFNEYKNDLLFGPPDPEDKEYIPDEEEKKELAESQPAVSEANSCHKRKKFPVTEWRGKFLLMR